jgi:hypothetical protein
MSSSHEQLLPSAVSGANQDADNNSTANSGWVDNVSKTWVETCQKVGNQTCIRVVNECPFEIEASLSALGVIYAKVTVPAASKVGIHPDSSFPSSVGVALLTCGYVWYTVSIAAYDNEGVRGPDVSIHGVYGGSRVCVSGTDTRWLSVETKNLTGAPEVKQHGYMQQLGEILDTSVVVSVSTGCCPSCKQTGAR